uniref:URB1 ribosome biogenesis homolog n=1 Tax=Esox lucius TaxID=8010 RepID=A0A3P8YWF7_ESOLU
MVDTEPSRAYIIFDRTFYLTEKRFCLDAHVFVLGYAIFSHFFSDKMGKKRSSEDADQSSMQPKKGKVSVSTEFNGTVFKAMLKEPSKAMKGLETFISISKKLPCPDLYDVVEGYIKISVECSEIFKLLEGDKKIDNEMMLIFQTLEMILLRTASDLSHFSMVGSTIVKKIVSCYMKLIQTSLSAENHRYVRQCLTLLSAMVSQGADTAREVFSHFHFSKGLSSLARRRDKMGRPDVRMAYIQFALSFLVSGDNAMIGQLLEIKDFLPDILSSGLKEDRISIVNLILSTLQTKVVRSKAISKTQKVRFFTQSVLGQIATLYRWNGIVDASPDDNQVILSNADEAGKMVVRELVHKFLLDLCCSRKHGLSFYDPSFGTAGRAGNIVLLQFVVSLKQAAEDELVSDLLVNILRVSPDILPRFFKETQFSFTPRLKSAWTDNIALLKKIYESQPELSKAFQAREVVPLPRLLSMVLVTSLPPVCNKVFFTQGLNFSNMVVQHTTLSLMSFLLKRAWRNIEFCLDPSVWINSDVYTPAAMEEFVQLYREAFAKVLPDMTSIVSKWQSLTKDRGEDKGKTIKKDGDVKEEQESPEVVFLKALILQVMRLYQKVVPHLVSQSKFDFSKLLKGIVTEKGVRQEVPPVLQHQILLLALELPASRFSWFRAQDHAEMEAASGERSVFYLLLKMFVSSSNSHLKLSTRKLVLKALRDTGVFEYTWSELELWLSHLARLEPVRQDTVVQFLERVLVRLVGNPHAYTDKVASLVQEAAYLQANLSGQEGDAVSIPVSHIDDVLDMVDVILEGSEGEMEELGPELSDDLVLQTFPFSALIPAVLEARNKLVWGTTRCVLFEYISAVLCDVLHCQRDPLPLSLALLQYDKELSSGGHPGSPHPSVLHLHSYYSTWLPQQTREQLVRTPPSRHSLIKCRHESLAATELHKFPVATKQVLLYVKTTVDNLSTVGRCACILKSHTVPNAAHLTQAHWFLLKHSAIYRKCASVVLSVLRSILKHPCIEQWFLCLELSSVPPTSLNPVRLKRLCAQLSDCVCALLVASAPTLRALDSLHLLRPYLEAVGRALLRELGERTKERQEESRPIRALLALQAYMEPSLLQELVSSLLLLPKETLLIHGEGDGAGVGPGTTELSVYGRTALQILSATTSASSSSSPLLLLLSQAHLQGLATLLLSCSSPSLEAFLLQALKSQPGNAKLIHTDVLLYCLCGGTSAAAQALAAALLTNCSTHRLYFEAWCLQPEHTETLASQTDAFLPLVNSYLQTAARQDPFMRPALTLLCPCAVDTVQMAVLKALKQALLPGLTLCVLGQDSKVTLGAVEALSSLLRLAAKVKDVRGLVDSLLAALQKLDGFESWQLVEPITTVLSDCQEDLVAWRRSVISAALRWLISSFSHNREPSAATLSQEDTMLKRLTSLLVTLGVRCRYRDPNFLSTLNGQLDLMYGGSGGPKDLVPLPTIHMMASSHSLFLATMLGIEGDLLKNALVTLLLNLVQRCPAVCNGSHFVVLMGAYGATLSATDQKLLLLLQEYERNNISLVDFQCLLWGPAAVEHHKTRRSLGVSLWQQPSSEDLLALLQPETMANTVRHFPLQRRIIIQESKEQIFKDCEVKDLGSVYDPCFLLPLFSAMLQPESVVDCLKFVSSHGLGVTVVSLSSYDPKLRAAAYQVLASYYHHLEAARFRERRQLLYLLDMVKNGIGLQNLRMPFILTTYIAKVAQQMLRPEEHMYVVVNRFLLSQQCLNFRRVPEFFKLFFSCDMEHKLEREWILSVLEEGLTDRHCYELLDQQGIFQTLLGFCCSPLCDDHTQVKHYISYVAGHVTKAAYLLTQYHGLLVWILQLLERRWVDRRQLGTMLELLHGLWFTNLGQKEIQGEGSSCSTAEDKPKEHTPPKVLPLPLINQFLCVATAIIRHLRLVKAGQLSLYLQTLSSILHHRDTALGAHREAGWLTLRPQTLSTVETLALLQRWSTLTHDAPLLSKLQAVAEKHRVKELLVQDKSVCCFSLPPQGRAERRGEQGEREEEALLEVCTPHLRSIFTHWEPVSPTCTSLPPSDPQTLISTPLGYTTAHLLTRWSLNSLVEGTSNYEEKATVSFLRWFQKTVLPHRDIMDMVLADPTVRLNLLRLYHVACEFQPQVSSGLEHLQLFTSIMTQLLEVQGCPKDTLNQAVLGACSLATTFDDHATKEAGVVLLSLYIHELWSGAARPELLLSHARLVAGTLGNTRRKSKRFEASTPLRAICSNILLGLQSPVAS